MDDVRSSGTREDPVRDFRTKEILEAARHVASKLGIAEASMERIAQEAGIAKGTIYLYFKNKEDLIVRVLQMSFDELMARSRRATENVENASGKLVGLVRGLFAHATEHEALFLALRERSAVGPLGTSLIEDEFDREVGEYITFVEGFIEQGIAAGEFRALPVRRFARLFTESLRGAARERYTETDRLSLDEEAELFADFFFNGIRVPGKNG